MSTETGRQKGIHNPVFWIGIQKNQKKKIDEEKV